MKDKFIVVDCMGIKQVGFETEDGTTTFSPDALVSMLNAMNALNKKVEKHVKGPTKALEVCGDRIEELENETRGLKERNNHLVLTLLKYI